jgi:hypothetical protein
MGSTMNQPENLDSPTVLLCRLHRWRMAFFGLIILIAGLVIGAAAAVLVLPRTSQERPPSPERGRQMMLERIMPRLGLSPEQARQVGPILQKHMQRLEEIREQGRTQIAEELDAMDESLSAVLTPDQQQRWRGLMRDLPGQFPREQGRYGPGPRGGQGPRGGGQGRGRRSMEPLQLSPNEPSPQN